MIWKPYRKFWQKDCFFLLFRQSKLLNENTLKPSRAWYEAFHHPDMRNWWSSLVLWALFGINRWTKSKATYCIFVVDGAWGKWQKSSSIDHEAWFRLLFYKPKSVPRSSVQKRCIEWRKLWSSRTVYFRLNGYIKTINPNFLWVRLFFEFAK